MSIEPRALVGVVIGLLFGFGAFCTLQDASSTVPFTVAAADFPPGYTLTAADVTVAQVNIDDAQALTFHPGDERMALVGRILQVPLANGQLIPRNATTPLLPLVEGEVAWTVATDDRSVWRDARPGGRVHIWVVIEVRDDLAEVTFVPYPLVLGAYIRDTFFSDDGKRQNVTLIVPDDPTVLDALSSGSLSGFLIFFVLPYEPNLELFMPNGDPAATPEAGESEDQADEDAPTDASATPDESSAGDAEENDSADAGTTPATDP